jgi:uncharacterized iron-regulated membrane protein
VSPLVNDYRLIAYKTCTDNASFVVPTALGANVVWIVIGLAILLTLMIGAALYWRRKYMKEADPPFPTVT